MLAFITSTTFLMILLFISLIIFIGSGIPVAISLGLSSLLIILLEPDLDIWIFFQRSMNSLNSFVLLAVPLFLLTGNIMNRSSISQHLIDFAQSIVGHISGGLAHVNIVVSMLFAGISGSSNADAAGIGSVLIPAMKKEGYPSSFSVSVTAVSAVMGNVIPPSLLMVVWSSITETSVAGLFIGGIIPGMMIGFGQMFIAWRIAKKRNYPSKQRSTLREILSESKHALIAMGTPLIIIGGIVMGYFTPTEAAVSAIIYSLIICIFIYRDITLEKFIEACNETARITALALFCLAMASIFGWLISYYQLPKMLLAHVNINSPGLLLVFTSIVMMFMGTFMDPLAIMAIVGALFLPLIEEAGIHTLHFGVVSIVALSLGFVTPPYGVCLLISSKIGEIPMNKALKDVLPFFIAMVIILLLIIFIPQLIMYLPKLLVPRFI